MLLSNLEELENDMIKEDWTICSFLFQYKGTEYIVLVKRFVGSEKRKNPRALVKLHFMKSNNLEDDLQVEASSYYLLIDAKTLREYFGIEYKENLGDILQQFTERLGKVIPKEVSDHPSPIETKVMLYSLSKSDSEDPNKIYCNKVRRNPNGGKRTAFNSDKTKLLRPCLFAHFRNEPNVSFCYYADRSMESDDATILINFAKASN